MFKRIWRWLTNQQVNLNGWETDDELYNVVYEAYIGGFTLASTYARANKEYLAIAASMGLITVKHPDGSYGTVWRATIKGMRFMKHFGSD